MAVYQTTNRKKMIGAHSAPRNCQPAKNRLVKQSGGSYKMEPIKTTIFSEAINRRNAKIKPLNLSLWHKFKMIIKRMYNGN